jgi:hypothetical protein
MSHAAGQILADDIAHACNTLEKKGGLPKHDRKRVKTERRKREALRATTRHTGY